MNLYERDLLPLDDILDCVGFSESTFWRVLKLWRETGLVKKETFGIRGRPRLLHHDDVQYLIRLVHHRPSWFLDELLDLLEDNRFISVHFTTIHRELVRAGMSRKKLRRIAKERNENVHANFIRRMAQYEPDQLGFLDETSKDERTVMRRNGWAKRGRRAEMQGIFVRGRRLSAEGLLTTDGMLATLIVEGSMTRQKYLEFLELTVVRVNALICILYAAF
jgi:transposase